MTTDQLHSNETKMKILQTAQGLFSKFGFDGTSIRDIAKESEVNLAAINYHFKNKENLFWEIIGASYERSDEISRRISETAVNLEDFASKLFDHFHAEQDLIRNTMKMLLSEKLVPPPESHFCQQMQKGSMGPPGKQYLAQFLTQEIPYKLKPSAIFWGVKSIFGTIIHWSTMCTTGHFEAMAEVEPMLKPQQIRRDVQMIVNATIEYMRNHPEHFKA